MKKLIILLMLMGLGTSAFCEAFGDSIPSRDYYLNRSKNQKDVGWVFLGGGTAMAVIGIIVFSQGNILSADDSKTDVGGFLVLGGIVTDLASIPFFISSGKNARKAATISLIKQDLFFPHHDGFGVRALAGISLKIAL